MKIQTSLVLGFIASTLAQTMAFAATDIDVYPRSLSFLRTRVGQTASQNVVIRNATDKVINSIQVITYGDSGQFYVDTWNCASLQPNASCYLHVTHRPNRVGRQHLSIGVTGQSAPTEYVDVSAEAVN